MPPPRICAAAFFEFLVLACGLHVPSSRDMGISSSRDRDLSEPRKTFQYGFFMQSANRSRAVQEVLSDVRKHYPREKIILYSDRSLDYSGMCRKYECSFAHAGAKAGIWGDDASGPRYLRRLVAAMRACDCETLVVLEDDTCLTGPLLQRPPQTGDIGGVSWPVFDRSFVDFAKSISGVVPNEPAVWGCTGGCYLRTSTLLAAFERRPGVLNASSAFFHDMNKHLIRHDGVAISKYGDLFPVAAAMLAGASVVPWVEASEHGLHYNERTRKTEKTWLFNSARLQHKCSKQLGLRNGRADRGLAREVSEEELDKLSEDGVLVHPTQ